MGEGRKNTGVKMRKRFGMRTGKNFCVEGNEINVMGTGRHGSHVKIRRR